MVDAGTHTVALNIFGRNTAFLDDRSLWVLWVGFDGEGLTPSPGSINEP